MLDGTETQDTTTAGTGETETPKTFSQEDVEKMLHEVRTSAMADVGRVTKAAQEGIKKATDSINARYQTLLASQAADFEELVKDNPDALAVIKERGEKRKLADEKARLEQELTEREERLQAYQAKETEAIKTVVVNEIAARLNVDAKTLLKHSKLTDGSKEAIEDIAKDLPKLTGNSPGGGRPDSTQTRGGSKGLTVEDVRKMSPEEQNRRTKEIAAIPF